MYTELIYQAQKAVIEERIQRTSRPQPQWRPRHTTNRRKRAAARIAVLGLRARGLDAA